MEIFKVVGKYLENVKSDSLHSYGIKNLFLNKYKGTRSYRLITKSVFVEKHFIPLKLE